jgi:signal transduction histidine kinase
LLANTVGLAHDAGNLLAALGLYCDLLSIPGVLRPEHQHYATELRLISERSSKLIQRLLTAPDWSASDVTQPSAAARLSLPPALLRRPGVRSSDAFAAITTASSHTPPNPVDMLRILTPILQRIAAGAATVTVTCPASLPPLDVSSEVIERITVNLVRNAAEAIRIQRCEFEDSSAPTSSVPPPGKILVTFAVMADRAQLTVEDNGPGMPPAIVASYLQPAPPPDGATRGLGHRIVHELATSTHGQLSIRVRPDHGTLFCLKWPIPGSAHDQRDSPDTSSISSQMTA